MKTLYESILDPDFDIKPEDVVELALNNLLNTPRYKRDRETEVKLVGDTYVFNFGAMLILDWKDLEPILSQGPYKKLVFNGYLHLTISSQCKSLKGYEIVAEKMYLLCMGTTVFEKCKLVATDYHDLSLDGSDSKIIFKNSTIQAESITIKDANVDFRHNTKVNIQYEIAFKQELTRDQLNWMKKNNIPLSTSDVGSMEPNMWTDPFHGLLTTDDQITDYVVIDVPAFNYIYKFYSVAAEYDAESHVYSLANGWTLVISQK